MIAEHRRRKNLELNWEKEKMYHVSKNHFFPLTCHISGHTDRTANWCKKSAPSSILIRSELDGDNSSSAGNRFWDRSAAVELSRGSIIYFDYVVILIGTVTYVVSFNIKGFKCENNRLTISWLQNPFLVVEFHIKHSMGRS